MPDDPRLRKNVAITKQLTTEFKYKDEFSDS